MESIELFVYGTLQRGQDLHNWIEEAIIRSSEGFVNGRLYPFGTGAFPVAYIAHEDDKDLGTIYGEIHTVTMTPDIVECIEMEVSAGYQPRWTWVTVPDGKKIRAMTFHWKHWDLPSIGKRIHTGRWSDYQRCHVVSETIMGTPLLKHEIAHLISIQEKIPMGVAVTRIEAMTFDTLNTDRLVELAKVAHEHD